MIDKLDRIPEWKKNAVLNLYFQRMKIYHGIKYLKWLITFKYEKYESKVSFDENYNLRTNFYLFFYSWMSYKT